MAWLALKPWPSLGRVSWFPRRLAAGLDGEDFLCNLGGYAVLTLVAHLTLPVRGPGAKAALAWRAGTLAMVVIGLETAQRWLPHRNFDRRDIAAGLLGVALATLPWLRPGASPVAAGPAAVVRPVE